jgi:GT2 family glycosyltransferase
MLSVIIPTHDRPHELRRALDALSNLQRAPGQLEVIVIDDGGHTRAGEVTAGFSDRLSVQCLRQERRGPAAARNAGARRASRNWLVFLDDDCEVAADWLTKLCARLPRHRDSMIGGATVNALDRNPYSSCHQLLLDYLYAHLNDAPDSAAFCASNNLAVPAAAFRDIGGFDEGFPFPAGEDRELCDRWRRSGRRLVYAPEVHVRHTHRMTFRSFFRQHFHYGCGAHRFHRLRLRRQPNVSWPQRPSFYGGLLATPLRAPLGQRPALFALVLTSQVATACGFVTDAVIRGRP